MVMLEFSYRDRRGATSWPFLICRKKEGGKKREKERGETKTNFPGREILIKPFMSKLGFHSITH